jgi:hypothetical protein
LQALTDDFEPVTLLTRLLILPGINTQAAFYEYWTAFLGIFAGDLCEAPPQFHIDVGDFLDLFAGLVRVTAVDCESDIRDGAAFWSELHLGITCDVPD